MSSIVELTITLNIYIDSGFRVAPSNKNFTLRGSKEWRMQNDSMSCEIQSIEKLRNKPQMQRLPSWGLQLPPPFLLSPSPLRPIKSILFFELFWSFCGVYCCSWSHTFFLAGFSGIWAICRDSDVFERGVSSAHAQPQHLTKSRPVLARTIVFESRREQIRAINAQMRKT